MSIFTLNMAALSNGSIYLPYNFDGDWTDEEVKRIKQVADKYMPASVGSMYNGMTFLKPEFGYEAKRDSWFGWDIHGQTLDEFIDSLTNYFNNYYGETS